MRYPAKWQTAGGNCTTSAEASGVFKSGELPMDHDVGLHGAEKGKLE